jgi:catechol 2,3-dioxygenase-like lactoylglutathione lyase family enzyme
MPWAPELFSAPLLQRVEEKWGHELVTVPFFDGLLAGEFDGLVRSFASEPELHHVGEIRHNTPIGGWDGGFAPGLDPDRGDYASFADFSDPDGNSWILQKRGYRAA